MPVQIFNRTTNPSGSSFFEIPPLSVNITVTIAAGAGGNGGADTGVAGGIGGAGKVGVFRIPDFSEGRLNFVFGQKGGDGTNTGVRGAYGQATGSQSAGSGGWGGNDRPSGTSGGGGGGGAYASLTFRDASTGIITFLAAAGGGGGGGGGSLNNSPTVEPLYGIDNNGEDGLSFTVEPTTFSTFSQQSVGGNGVGGGYTGPTFTTSGGTLNYVDTGDGGGAGGGGGGYPPGRGRDANGNRVTTQTFVGGEQWLLTLGGEYAGNDYNSGTKPNVASGGPGGGSVYIADRVTLLSESLNSGDGYVRVEYDSIDPKISSFTSTTAISEDGIPDTEVTLQWSLSENVDYTYEIIRGGTAVPVLDTVGAGSNTYFSESYYNIQPGTQKIVVVAYGGGGGGSSGIFNVVGGAGGGGGSSCVVEVDDIQANETTVYINPGDPGTGGNTTGSPNGVNGGDTIVRFNSPTGALICTAGGGKGAVINVAQNLAPGGAGGTYIVGSRGNFLAGGNGGTGARGGTFTGTGLYYGGGGGGGGGFNTNGTAAGGQGINHTESGSSIHQGQGFGAGGGGGAGGFRSDGFWRGAGGGGAGSPYKVGTFSDDYPYPISSLIPEIGTFGLTARVGGGGGRLSVLSGPAVNSNTGGQGYVPGGGGGGSSRDANTVNFGYNIWSNGGVGGDGFVELWAFNYSDVTVDGGVVVDSGDQTVNTSTVSLGVTSQANVNSPVTVPFHLILNILGQYKIFRTINVLVKNDNTPTSVTVGTTAIPTTSGNFNRPIDNLEPNTQYYVQVSYTGVDMNVIAFSPTSGVSISDSTTNWTSGNKLIPVTGTSGNNFYIRFTSLPFNLSTTPGGTVNGEIVGQTNTKTINFNFGSGSYSFNAVTRAPVIQEVFNLEGTNPTPNSTFPNPDIDTNPVNDPDFILTDSETLNDIEIDNEIKVSSPDVQVRVNGVEWINMREI